MSAPRASEIDAANPFPDLAIAGTELRTVLLPGSPATYANRTVLREMGLRWDPVGHRWHGTTTVECVKTLRERLGLEVRCFGSLEIEPPRGPSPPKPPVPARATVEPAMSPHVPARRPHDGSRTLAEARTAYHTEGENGVAQSRFSEWDITSGLPDDSREEDKREEERRLRDLRGRVKLARAVVSTTPGLADILVRDWEKAARFYARFGVTETQFRLGVPPTVCGSEGDLSDHSSEASLDRGWQNESRIEQFPG